MDLVINRSGGLAPLGRVTHQELIDTFLSGLNPNTLNCCRLGLAHFAAYLGVSSPSEVAQRMAQMDGGRANLTVEGYKRWLLESGKSPNTINNRLASVRSLLKLARKLGVVAYTLEVDSVPSQVLRDTRGPGNSGYRKLLASFQQDSSPAALRDRAIIRLLYDCGLRRGEVSSLDLASVDWTTRRILVVGKGKSQAIPVTVPLPTLQALAAWVLRRGSDAGPLFVSLDRCSHGARLSGHAIHRLVVARSKKIGLHIRPHGLRHAAITHALAKHSIRAVQRFSRHAKIETVLRYDDNRQDLGGAIAQDIASDEATEA